MSRFKRIKNTSTKKSSVSIDEKIASLNQELEKTGMLSERMTTGNVLSTSEYVPPQEYKEGEVPNHSGIGGEGFTQNSAGSGVAGDAPNHSSVSDLYNSDVGHPIYASTSYNGVSSYGIVIGPSFGAGTSYGIIEGGNTYRQVLGGFLAGGTRGPGNYEAVYRGYLQTNENTPGFYSQEQIDQALENWQLAIQVHAKLVEIGFDNSRFNVTWKAWRRPILFEDLSTYPSYAHPEKGTVYLVPFNVLGMPNTYAEQDARPPGTTNPQRRGLEDEPIYPGPIATLFDLGQRAFDWLKEQARKARKRGEEIKKKRGGGKPNRPGSGFPDPIPEPDPTEPDPTGGYTPTPQGGRGGGQGNPTNPRGGGTTPTPNTPSSPTPTGPYTPTPQGGSGGGQGNPTNQPGSGTQTQTQTSSTSTEPDPTEKTYEKNRKNNRPDVTGGGEAEELLQTAVATMLDFADNPIKYAVQGLLNLGGLLTGQDGVATSFNNLVHHTNNNNPLHPDFRKNDPSSDNYEGPAEVQTSDANRKNIVNALDKIISNLNGGKGPTNPNGNLTNAEIKKLSDEMKKNYKNNKTNQAYNTFYNSFHSLPTGGDRGDGKPVTTVTVKDGKFVQLDSNYWFTDPVDANPLLSDKSTGLDLKQLPSTIISNVIHGVTNQATGSGVWTPGSDGEPFYSDENKTEIIGTQYNTQQSFTAKPPKSNKNVKESYITEGVGLGLYEPEAMNVDLADIRKGIMPEYPKKPPAEMIDGYHEKSPLRPKPLEKEPYVKITKADLIRNHRLKPKEADEMMNTINMVNAHIKAHPEDLIHAQMRYPKDDPRLAELNWKMDQMLDAGKEYMDSNFKENKKLYKRAMDRTKNNIKLTDPEYVQQKYDELRGTPKPKKSINKRNVSRFFKKPTKKKSSMEEIDDKIKQLDKDLLL